MKATKRRNVKSGAADAHERAKDYLDPPEMLRLLEAAKDGRARRSRPRPAARHVPARLTRHRGRDDAARSGEPEAGPNLG